jgi:hypothetical protein
MKLLFVLWKTACSLRVIVLMSDGEAGYYLYKNISRSSIEKSFSPGNATSGYNIKE